MAINRPRVDTNAVSCTSVVLGYYKGPKITTYHETFELNRPNQKNNATKRFEIKPAEIFRRTEKMFPLTMQQASFGEISPSVTTRIYNIRQKALKDNMDVHLLNAVPIDSRLSCDSRQPPTASQMKSDYREKHTLLNQWLAIQNMRIPKLPPINMPKKNKMAVRQTEAKYQFQWPKKDGVSIHQVTFKKL